MPLESERILQPGREVSYRDIDIVFEEVLDSKFRTRVHQLIAGRYQAQSRENQTVKFPDSAFQKNLTLPFQASDMPKNSVILGSVPSGPSVLNLHRWDILEVSTADCFESLNFSVRGLPGEFLAEFIWKQERGADEACNWHREVKAHQNRGRGFGVTLQQLAEDYFFKVKSVSRMRTVTRKAGTASFFMNRGFVLDEQYLTRSILTALLQWDHSSFRHDIPEVELTKQNPVRIAAENQEEKVD